jgi:hypothetical protein
MNEETPKNTGENQATRDEKGRFIKGVSGNPDGKPVGTKSFTSKVREALQVIAEGRDYSYEEAFIKSILHKGIIEKDSAIIKLIWSYLDGLPAQRIDLGNAENMPFKIDMLANSIKKLADDNGENTEENTEVKRISEATLQE